jgi:hypothetical protein
MMKMKKMQRGLHDDVSKAPRTSESSPSDVHFTATEVEFAGYRLVHDWNNNPIDAPRDFLIRANRFPEEDMSIFVFAWMLTNCSHYCFTVCSRKNKPLQNLCISV